MIHELEANEYFMARHLFRALDFHLGVLAVLDGTAPGRVYVDDATEPKSTLVRSGRRFYLAGAAHNPAFNADVRTLFCEQVYPQALQAGEIEFVVYYDSQDWDTRIQEILKDRYYSFAVNFLLYLYLAKLTGYYQHAGYRTI